jgi:hypothetical protein
MGIRFALFTLNAPLSSRRVAWRLAKWTCGNDVEAIVAYGHSLIANSQLEKHMPQSFSRA